MPAPAAWPATAEITGLGKAANISAVSATSAMRAAMAFGSVSPMVRTSPPAQKFPSAPVITSTSTPESSLRAERAARKRLRASAVSALRASGSSRVMTAMRPSSIAQRSAMGLNPR